MSKTDEVLEKIRTEREYQNKEWGKEFDKLHNINDLIAFMVRYLGQASMEYSDDKTKGLESFTKAVTIGVAALEIASEFGWKPTHYESLPDDGRKSGETKKTEE